MRTGAEYLRSLNDGRQVFLDGERVKDVTAHRAFREAARSAARLYDIAAAPELRERMTFPSPKTRAPVLRAYQIPRNHADLAARRAFSETWAEATFGLMGRTPDHVAGFFCGYAATPQVFAAGAQPFLHPGRSAVVSVGETEVGWVGDVHPLAAAAWDLDGVAAFELDLDAVIAHAGAIPVYEDLTSFPELREDIAIVVDSGVPAARVLELVRDAGGGLLARAEVFDVYRGEQVAAGRTSLAIALTFRAPDRTLTDADVAPVRERIVARLGSELGGELRG